MQVVSIVAILLLVLGWLVKLGWRLGVLESKVRKAIGDRPATAIVEAAIAKRPATVTGTVAIAKRPAAAMRFMRSKSDYSGTAVNDLAARVARLEGMLDL